MRRHEATVFNAIFYDKEEVTEDDIQRIIADVAKFFDLPTPEINGKCESFAEVLMGDKAGECELLYNLEVLKKVGINNKDAFTLCFVHEMAHQTLYRHQFMLMLPTVFTGKCTLLMLVAYALFTAGAEYCMFFQMAVFNKQTIPLNTKFIGKGSMETNYLQIVVELGIFIVPVAFISIVTLLLSETVAHIIIMSVGLAFILLHKIWIRNVYSRMMKRRYQNMEGFRSTRE